MTDTEAGRGVEAPAGTVTKDVATTGEITRGVGDPRDRTLLTHMIHMTVGQDVTTTRDLVGMIVVIAEDTLDLHLVMVVG